MSRDPAEDLEQSWIANAEGWTRAVREGRIASRQLATDAAVVEAVRARTPNRVLDVGCGEGWLVRALADLGMEVVGVDASAPLIEAAREGGPGTFHVRSYAEIAAHPLALGTGFDVATFNFSLLEDSVHPVLRAVREVLSASGSLVVQTVHPWTARGEGPYRDGWRVETFAGLSAGFAEPMPWYYRTLSSWVTLLHRSGYRISELREPVHPETGEPLSLLFVCEPGVHAGRDLANPSGGSGSSSGTRPR